jgi:hypothetical protein
MKNKLQRLLITEKQYKEFLRILSAHEDIYISTPTSDKVRLIVKPARKGRVYGNGQDKYKETLYDYRVSARFTIEFKGDLARSKALTI